MQQHVRNIKLNQKRYRQIYYLIHSTKGDKISLLFHIRDTLLHNYVQHEKCLPSVTKNYELYYSLKMVS